MEIIFLLIRLQPALHRVSTALFRSPDNHSSMEAVCMIIGVLFFILLKAFKTADGYLVVGAGNNEHFRVLRKVSY